MKAPLREGKVATPPARCHTPNPAGPSRPFLGSISPESSRSSVPVVFQHILPAHYYSSVIPGLGRVRWTRTELCLVRATDSSQGGGCWEAQEGVSEEVTGAPHPSEHQQARDLCAEDRA